MRNIAQLGQDLVDPPGAQDQRVAAGKQHVVHLRMGADVVEPPGDVQAHFFVVEHEQPLAKAEAAVRATDLADQQQHGRRVLVLGAVRHGHRLLVAGIQHTVFQQLVVVGNDDLADRVVRVVPVDQSHVIGVGSEDEALGDLFEPVLLFWGELWNLFDITHVAHF